MTDIDRGRYLASGGANIPIANAVKMQDFEALRDYTRSLAAEVERLLPYESGMHALCDRINQYASNKGTYQTPNCAYEGMKAAMDGVMFALAEERNEAQRELDRISAEVERLTGDLERAHFDRGEERARLAEEIVRLRTDIERLEPYRKSAEFHERLRAKQEQEQREIAAGLRCGQGYLNCNGGPDCYWDHK